MPIGLVFASLAAAGALVAVLSLFALHASGAQPALARRLAGPPERKVGSLLGSDRLPQRPVRVVGRIRCRDPLDMGGDERLVAFHRDVEVRMGGAWRSVERLRETRSFELWDHDGSLTLDPASTMEPLVVIPKVWRGDPAELEEPHASAVARLTERHGEPAMEARAVTRAINVTDRLLVLARAARDPAGKPRLAPPDGGYIISNLALPDAMRLLGGRHRRLAVAAVVGVAVSIALLAMGGIGALLNTLVL